MVSPAPPPRWHPIGPALVVALAPPRLEGAGALYRDALWGTFAVFARQDNATRHPLDVGVSIANPAPVAVRLCGFWHEADGAATRPGACLVLPPNGHVLWATRVGPGREVRLRAGGRARWAPAPLGAFAAPVVVTVFAYAGPPRRPDRLAMVSRAGGVRATFPHSVLALAVAARPRAALALPRPVWPAASGVDAVDGLPARLSQPGVFALRLSVSLPASRRGAVWRLVARRVAGGPAWTLAALGAAQRPRTVVCAVAGDLLADAGSLSLVPPSTRTAGGSRRPRPTPDPRGPRSRGWGANPRAPGTPPAA